MPLVHGVDVIGEQIIVRLRTRVLSFAAERGADSAHFVSALADVVGIVAAKLDVMSGSQSFADRMHAFTQRAEQTYRRALSDLGAKKTGT